MGSRLLMIEDDRDLATMVAEYLGRYGFELELAHRHCAGPSMPSCSM
jgi:DNA-binding response OmpR family regulator